LIPTSARTSTMPMPSWLPRPRRNLICAVTLVNNEVVLRARIARKLLGHLGHPAVLALGEARSLDGRTPPGWHAHEGDGIELPVDAGVSILTAPEAILSQLGSEGVRVIVAIGQLTNVALTLRSMTPEARQGLSVYAMASSFRGFGREAAEREHNAVCDLPAVREVLASGVTVRLVGLNVTQHTTMTRADVRLEQVGTPLATDLASMHHIWLDQIGREESPMHDPLTVAAILDPALLRFQTLRAEVDVNGQVVVFYDDGEPNCEVAVEVDAPAFQELFMERVLAAL
jgi:inosine-uridine nucleoside N-ribohydrolase